VLPGQRRESILDELFSLESGSDCPMRVIRATSVANCIQSPHRIALTSVLRPKDRAGQNFVGAEVREWLQ
jgi:hypothetical protein